jgi:hypothetical protein
VLVGIVAVIDFRRNISDGVRPLIPSCSLASLYALTNISYLSEDRYPVVKDHSLIVPIRHIYSFFNLGTAEQKTCFKLLEEQKDGLKKRLFNKWIQYRNKRWYRRRSNHITLSYPSDSKKKRRRN